MILSGYLIVSERPELSLVYPSKASSALESCLGIFNTIGQSGIPLQNGSNVLAPNAVGAIQTAKVCFNALTRLKEVIDERHPPDHGAPYDGLAMDPILETLIQHWVPSSEQASPLWESFNQNTDVAFAHVASFPPNLNF